MLRKFFELFLDQNIVISLVKSTFFTKEIKWCGENIDSSGITLDTSNYERISDVIEAHTAGELCQFVQCISWMRSAVPRLSDRAASLFSLLEAAYEKVGKRKNGQ